MNEGGLAGRRVRLGVVLIPTGTVGLCCRAEFARKFIRRLESLLYYHSTYRTCTCIHHCIVQSWRSWLQNDTMFR